MSVEAINWALSQETAEPVDKLILIALANYAGADHSSFPSRRKLAEIGMCSVDTVDRANRRLEERGLISKQSRLHPKGGKASNCYVLAVEGVAAPCGQDSSRTMRGGQPHHAARVAAQLSGEGSRIGCGHKEPLKEPLQETSIPLTPKGANDDGKGNSVVDWSHAFETQADADGVKIVAGRVSIAGKCETFWLEQFGDAEALRLALIEITGQVQPNNRAHGLKVQVERQLARILREKRDRDVRYQTAVKTNAAAKSVVAKSEASREAQKRALMRRF